MTGLRPARRAARCARAAPSPTAGSTLIEVMVVITILAVSVSIFSGMVVTTARQRTINRETAIATEAARVLIETMRNTPFREVYLRWNDDPDDDPEGAGTAPGHRFAVGGLEPLGAAADGLVGEVHFPDELVDVDAGGGAPVAELQLREDLVDDELGTPRDLNGDSIIDGLDHAEDYILLPVHVDLRWEGVVGPRRLRLHTILTEFQRADG